MGKSRKGATVVMQRLGDLETLCCANSGCHQILSLIFGKRSFLDISFPIRKMRIQLLNNGAIRKTLALLLLEAFINSCVQIFKCSLLDTDLGA